MSLASSTIPAHLPNKLTTTLWDFSWYTQTAPGEPFHDLDQVFSETVERGYNTIRICAAPVLLFGDHGIDTSSLRFANMGGEVGQKTRWYDARGGETLNLRARLLELFQRAKEHGVYVIVSSWEFQQSPAFLEGPEWFTMLEAIPADRRYLALADAQSALMSFLKEHGLDDRVAYVELHNEVDLSHFGTEGFWKADDYWEQAPLISEAVDAFRSHHPDVLCTVCFGVPPFIDMGSISSNLGVAHHHFYAYGVLRELVDWAQFLGSDPYPSPEFRSLLLPGAPDFEGFAQEVEPWRWQATVIMREQFYAYDWADPIAWDSWLYRNYSKHEIAMKQALDVRLTAVANWARRTAVPVVIGEGWIGYTPYDSNFEDGPIGQEISAFGARRCAELGFWGTLVGSNRTPVHPGWADIDFQRRINQEFLSSESE